MKIEFIKPHDRFKKGERCEMLRMAALELIASGIAKAVDDLGSEAIPTTDIEEATAFADATDINDLPEFLTRKEVADLLGCTVSDVVKSEKAREITRAIAPGRIVKYRTSDIIELIRIRQLKETKQ